MIFTLLVESQRTGADGALVKLKARLNVMDLAGSEGQSKSGAKGERLEEAKSINQSLLTLGMVIISLAAQSEGQRLGAAASRPHIPYPLFNLACASALFP